MRRLRIGATIGVLMLSGLWLLDALGVQTNVLGMAALAGVSAWLAEYVEDRFMHLRAGE
ncbi:hypothetical protein ACQR1I_17235 [Bradyrhizobium sp. HKCCYLS2038]|uniref:hypothetical protein n=1 Tax=unclassified Bradyrhizobium TaxID=2631580 RepID=UPI003EB79DC4